VNPPFGHAPRGPGSSVSHSARRVVLGLLALAFLAFVAFPWFASFVGDWLWFREIQFEPVYFTSLLWRAVLFVGGAAFAFGLVYGNISWARRGSSGFPTLFVDRGGGVRVDISHLVPRLFLICALLAAFITGVSASSLWLTVVMAMHGATVGTTDPLFARDIGFYLFSLPVI
jgi:uncharacterized membrane protein (UPF0182 family)